MKRVLKILPFILIITFFSACSNSQPTPQSKLDSNKVIIYDIKRKGCPACAYQERVFRVPEVKELLDKYCQIIYVDVSEQDKLPKKWMHTHKTPTVHFVDANNNKLIPSIGSVYPYEFRDAILKAKAELDKRAKK